VNYLKKKQSNRLGDTSRFAFTLAWHMIVLAVRRRLHGKNLLIQEPSSTYVALVRGLRFFKRLHAFNRFSLSAVRDWTSRRRNI